MVSWLRVASVEGHPGGQAVAAFGAVVGGEHRAVGQADPVRFEHPEAAGEVVLEGLEAVVGVAELPSVLVGRRRPERVGDVAVRVVLRGPRGRSERGVGAGERVEGCRGWAVKARSGPANHSASFAAPAANQKRSSRPSPS